METDVLIDYVFSILIKMISLEVYLFYVLGVKYWDNERMSPALDIGLLSVSRRVKLS